MVLQIIGEAAFDIEDVERLLDVIGSLKEDEPQKNNENWSSSTDVSGNKNNDSTEATDFLNSNKDGERQCNSVQV